MKKLFAILLSVAMVLSMSVTAWAESASCDGGENCTHQAAIDNTHYDTLHEALEAVNNNATATLLRDVNLSNWTSIKKSNVSFTFDGNEHTITGLTQPLFQTVGWNNAVVTIKNLTIKDSTIVDISSGDGNGASDGAWACAALIAWVEEAVTLTIEGCHVDNVSVTSKGFAGGLVGYIGGYANSTITGSVKDSTLSGGTVGGVLGLTNGNTTISGEIGNNIIAKPSGDKEYIGTVAGTATGSGSITVNVTETAPSKVTVNGTAIDAAVCGDTYIQLNITGGTYYSKPGAVNGHSDEGGSLVVDEEKVTIAKPPRPSRPSGGSSRPSGQWFTTTLEDIQKVTVGGKVLDSQYYTVAGTDVLISQEYIDKLAGGSYQVVIENATHIARGTLTVKGAASVESAKTFDAGIALYAGMALSSAMGAAYVCSKKKC